MIATLAHLQAKARERISGAENEQRVSYEALESAVSSLFQACGMNTTDAGLFAATLVTADLRAVHSQDTMRMPDYVGKLNRKGVDTAR